MKKENIYCCCTQCHKEVTVRGLHSHILSAHTDEGRKMRSKCGVKSSSTSSALNHLKKQRNIEKYNSNPKLCLYCNKPIPYEKRSNKFCNASCGARFNNNKRTHPPKIQTKRYKKKHPTTYCLVSFCVMCGNSIPNKNIKACSSSCRSELFRTHANAKVKAGLLGGNKNNRAYGWYISPFAGKVWLESSYEYKVAKSLDHNNINWTRPSYILYDNKRYFPDFYLTDYNVYLDPKNDYLITQDRAKIDKVQQQNNITVIILDKTQLSWKEIQLLL